jgi:steroid delta-isomerase
MPADASDIRHAIDAYCAAFSSGDRDAYVSLFASDAWIEDPVGTPRHAGHDGIGGFFDQMAGMADSIELRRTGPVRIAAGEAAWPLQARPNMGGSTMMVDIIDVMTFDDTGKITTMRAFWDPAEMRPAED